jgi:release factor glutamine methyltransferase
LNEVAPRTVGEALDIARLAFGSLSETPALDGQLLIAEALGSDRAGVLTHPERILTPPRAEWFLEALRRCAAGEALPYVLGWWEFFGRRFRLTPEVLIPRPETELLVEVGLSYLAAHPSRHRVADIGAGSGCITVSIAAERASVRVVASDLSRGALQLARSNAAKHGVADRVAFVKCDLIPPTAGRFDLVCANLPYIPSAVVDGLAVGGREPRLALDGGLDGLGPIRRLFSALPAALAAGGLALVEIEASQGGAVLAEARGALPDSRITLQKDLAGRDRLIVIEARHEGLP